MKSERTSSHKRLLIFIFLCGFVVVFLSLTQHWLELSPSDRPKYYKNIFEDKRFLKGRKSEKEDFNVSLDSSSSRQNNATATKQRYYVYTEHCKMAYVNPFTSEIKRKYRPSALENCSTVERLVESGYDANLQQYFLNIRSDVARTLANYSGDISCCYKEILRKNDDDRKISLQPCIDFGQNFMVPPHIEGILTECYSANRTKLLQMDGYTFVQKKPPSSDLNERKINKSRKPNVLLFGIDSLSRINFRRTMLKTYQYVKFNGWYEMQGYNKVGDNTFPNLMALMTGYSGKNAKEKFQIQQAGGLDVCPLLWKNFHMHGYRTAYAEDESGMSTFNYLQPGFQRRPTDHYMRPFMLAFEKYLEKKKRCGLTNCLGKRHPTQYIYDYAIQLAERYNEEPVFGLFWSNSFSHNCYDTPSAMDHIINGYMQDFERLGILERSIVVLFSDHGMRWGELLELPESYFEERLPMLFIWLPLWYRKQYPEIVEALQLNRNRLTSPYDLHMTFKHILELTTDDGKESSIALPPPYDCPRCQSLFYVVPLNRTCDDAGIPEHWCTCLQYEALKKNSTHEKIAKLVVDAMNRYLSQKDLIALCSEIHLDKVEKVYLQVQETAEHPLQGVNTFLIKYRTLPNKAEFQATVIYFEYNSTVSLDVESISRINSYESDSKCVNDKQAKKYCICRNAVVKD